MGGFKNLAYKLSKTPNVILNPNLSYIFKLKTK